MPSSTQIAPTKAQHDALAARVAALESHTYGTVAATDGFAVNLASAERVGNFVFLLAWITGTPSGETTVAYVSEGFRPAVASRGPLGHAGKVTAASSEYCIVRPDGGIVLNSTSNINLVMTSYPAA